jgi:dTDP-4-amino-4,6-dideoxygalactose transaminase
LAIQLLEPYKLTEASNSITKVLEDNWISYSGQYVGWLEQKIAKYTGSMAAVATCNGTSGLWLILKGLGIGPGDKVIVPTMTFVATVNAVIQTGAEPVFVDCDKNLQICITDLECALKHEPDVKVIMPVHLLGNMCNMRMIQKLAEEYGVDIVEDAAQALGTKDIYTGKHAGTFGKAGMISFSFNKMITGGSGGIVITDDEEFAAKLKYFSTQAKDDAEMYIHNNPGFNLGLSNINACLALNQFYMLDEILYKKKRIWQKYIDAYVQTLSAFGSNHWLNAIHTRGYKETSKKLTGIQTRPLFYPNHLQKSFTKYNYYGGNNAIEAYNSVMCIPSSAGITEEQQDHVIQLIKRKVY